MAEKQKTVEQYTTQLPSDQQAIIAKLRAIVMTAAPEAKESIKWAQPVYEVNGPMAYIKAYSGQVNFGFWRGTELTDPHNLLVGSGDRMKHVKLKSVSEINEVAFADFVRQASHLNQELGNPTRTRKSKS